jgi:hypothetical protein
MIDGARDALDLVFSRVEETFARWRRRNARRVDRAWAFLRRRFMPAAELTPRGRHIYAALKTAIERRRAG